MAKKNPGTALFRKIDSQIREVLYSRHKDELRRSKEELLASLIERASDNDVEISLKHGSPNLIVNKDKVCSYGGPGSGECVTFVALEMLGKYPESPLNKVLENLIQNLNKVEITVRERKEKKR